MENKISFSIEKDVTGIIIGKKGNTIKNLCDKNSVDIKIINKKEFNEITIFGNEYNVIKVYHIICSMISKTKRFDAPSLIIDLNNISKKNVKFVFNYIQDKKGNIIKEYCFLDIKVDLFINENNNNMDNFEYKGWNTRNNNNELVIINNKNSINELNSKINEIIENVKIKNKDKNITISNYYMLTKTIGFKNGPENIVGKTMNIDNFIEIYKKNKIQPYDLIYFNFKKYDIDKIFKKNNFIKKEYYITTIKGCYQNDEDKSWHRFVHELQVSPECEFNKIQNNIPQNLSSSIRLIILSPFLQTGLGMELVLRFENINKIPDIYPQSVINFLNQINNEFYNIVKKNNFENQEKWDIFDSSLLYNKDICCDISIFDFNNTKNIYITCCNSNRP